MVRKRSNKIRGGFEGVGWGADVDVLPILQPVGLSEKPNANVVVKGDEKDKERREQGAVADYGKGKEVKKGMENVRMSSSLNSLFILLSPHFVSFSVPTGCHLFFQPWNVYADLINLRARFVHGVSSLSIFLFVSRLTSTHLIHAASGHWEPYTYETKTDATQSRGQPNEDNAPQEQGID